MKHVCNLLLWATIFANEASAANWFLNDWITSGSANTGVDWNNAWTNVSSVVFGSSCGLNAGDTLYVAGGIEYTNDFTGSAYQKNHSFAPSGGVSGTPGSPITVRRARGTNSACASVAGWNASYDAQPILHCVSLWGNGYPSGGLSNWVFNGEIPYVGMMITNSILYAASHTFDLRYGASFITVSNCEIHGCNATNVPNQGSSCWYSGVGCLSNHISRCIMRDADTLIVATLETGLTIENSILANSYSCAGCGQHANLMLLCGNTNLTLRDCLITNLTVEGILFNSASIITNFNIYIYGNVWWNPSPGVSRILEGDQGNADTEGPIYFFNNTVVGFEWTIMGGGNGTYSWWNPGCASSNNIVFTAGGGDANFNNGGAAFNSDYNLSSNNIVGAHSISGAVYGNTFSDFNSFAISPNTGLGFPRGNGANLGPAYAVDANGTQRPASGAWDIGALEYTGSPGIVGSPPIRPSPPWGLTVTNSPP